jgi:ABC-type amino acid transport substrate-binding protein
LKRSEKMLLSGGDLDGESVRIPEFSDRVPNLVIVKEPTAVSNFVAYSADSMIQADTVESLLNGHYSIAYPAGNVMLVSLFKQSAQPLALTEVWSTHQGLALVESKRVDLFLGVTSNVEHELNVTTRFRSTLFHVGTPVKASFHIFLRKEFEVLAEQLSEALREMKDSGAYEAYISEYDIKIL